MTGFIRICPVENNLYVYMAITLILYILMIYRTPRNCLVPRTI